MTIGVGLAGFGLAGRILHAPFIAPAGMVVRAVATSRADEVAADFPDAQCVAEFDALLKQPDVDLVVIVTPNRLHYPQAKAALEAGKHVVVDKPFTLSYPQADELDAFAKSKNLKLSVFQNRRWDSDFLTIQKLIQSGQLGTILRFEMRWDRYRPSVQDRWRERPGHGNGMLFDLGSHLFDQSLQLFGAPDWVQADVAIQRDGGEADDSFDVLMGKGKLRISLGVSSVAADNQTRYRIYGEQGAYTKSGLDVQEAQMRAGIAPDADGFGKEPESQWGSLFLSENEGQPHPPERGNWLTFYSAMREAIELDAPVPVSARSAGDVVALIELASEAASSGKRIHLSDKSRWAN
ncbi:MAG: Gfo/Idh/MocA family oxidoreductase [Pseudomonadota bacterium]